MGRRRSVTSQLRANAKRHATMAANWHVHMCEHCNIDYCCYKVRCKLKKKKLCSGCRWRQKFGLPPASQIPLPMKHASNLAGFVEDPDGNWTMVLVDGRTLPVTEEYVRDGVWHA